MFNFAHPNRDVELEFGRSFNPEKPDIDNLMKPLFDALEGCVYSDDSAIVRIQDAQKKWSNCSFTQIALSWRPSSCLKEEARRQVKN